MQRPDASVLRPSSHFQKLTYEEVCTILALMDEVDASTKENDRLDGKEKQARDSLLAIKNAMEDKRAREDAERKTKKKSK